MNRRQKQNIAELEAYELEVAAMKVEEDLRSTQKNQSFFLKESID